jgi:hypothetical protein
LELPIPQKNRGRTFREAPTQHLLSAYHHRRTSGCYVSLIPRKLRNLAAVSGRLPEPDALEHAKKVGFTTIIAHHRSGRRGPNRRLGFVIDRRFRKALADGDSGRESIAYAWPASDR